jgi:hypothetical protein
VIGSRPYMGKEGSLWVACTVGNEPPQSERIQSIPLGSPTVQLARGSMAGCDAEMLTL